MIDETADKLLTEYYDALWQKWTNEDNIHGFADLKVEELTESYCRLSDYLIENYQTVDELLDILSDIMLEPYQLYDKNTEINWLEDEVIITEYSNNQVWQIKNFILERK